MPYKPFSASIYLSRLPLFQVEAASMPRRHYAVESRNCDHDSAPEGRHLWSSALKRVAPSVKSPRGDYLPGTGRWGFEVTIPSMTKERKEYSSARGWPKEERLARYPAQHPTSNAGSASADELVQRIQGVGAAPGLCLFCIVRVMINDRFPHGCASFRTLGMCRRRRTSDTHRSPGPLKSTLDLPGVDGVRVRKLWGAESPLYAEEDMWEDNSSEGTHHGRGVNVYDSVTKAQDQAESDETGRATSRASMLRSCDLSVFTWNPFSATENDRSQTR